MATNFKVTELDFDQIKKNLKNYLKTQSTFNDYDFEGSGMSVLLDVLAYNTHYNAMAAHFSLNEAFLDSAQIRGNVVSRARLLGYTPRSKLASRAVVNIAVTGFTGDQASNNPANLTLARGTQLVTTVGGREFSFIVLSADNATIDSVTNVYTFNNVEIAEGTLKTLKFRVDNDLTNQKYQISDKDADTSTLRVRVQANDLSSAFDIYTKYTTLLNVDAATRIFHLQENANEYYEVFFGDGVIGARPQSNNIVTLDYVFTNGKDVNGATNFGMGSNINIGPFSASAVSISLVNKSTGGSDRETLESIRYNAPLTFTSQNRAVTTDDYRAIIQREFSDIDAISTWGGEDNDPPDYGSVYVCVKPVQNETLTDAQKNTIKNTILKGKNVVSITPVMVDPNYTYLELDVFFKYNNNLTDRSASDLLSVVSDTVEDYSFNNLNKFDGVFRHSQLLKAIDNADPSIVNSTVRPMLFKTITPSLTRTANNFTLFFTGSFYVSGSSTDSVISSTAFKVDGVDHFFGDEAVEGQDERRVYVYKIVDGKETIVVTDAGSVNTSSGKVILNNFAPSILPTGGIRITVTPASLDIAPKRDQLIAIDPLRTTITPEIDSIAVSGSTGTISYNTTSRLRG